MSTVTDWLMVIITGVYVIATIFICVFNYKSAKASREQLEESKMQFISTNCPNVIAGIRIENNYFMCLFIKNIGRETADNIDITINDDWFQYINGDDKKDFEELLNNKFMLVPGQEIYRIFTRSILGYGISIIDDFNDIPLKVKITYTDRSINKSFSDEYAFDVKLFRPIIREKTLNEKEIKEISKTLKDIEKKIKLPVEIKVKK